jgi:hypothetical protein
LFWWWLVLYVILASSGVFHYLSIKLNSNGFILSITSICILLFIEGSKRFTLESYHAQRIDDNKIHKITYAFIMLWGCLSIGSTYYGTPYAIEYFAASPKLVSIDSIKNDINHQLKKHKSILEAEIDKHSNTAKDIKDRSSWKGKISRSARPAYLAAVTAKKDSEVQLSKLSILANEQKALKVDAAIKENQQIVKKHSSWCYSFGSTLAVISVFLELLFFGAFWWCENYKRLEVLEARTITELQTDNSNRTSTINTNGVRLAGTDNRTNTHRTVVAGFNNDKPSNIMRTCSNCGTDISSKRSDAIFCSTKCRGSHHKNKK